MRDMKSLDGSSDAAREEIAASFHDDDYARQRAEVVEKILGNTVEIIRLLRHARSAIHEYRGLNIELDGVITEDANG